MYWLKAEWKTQDNGYLGKGRAKKEEEESASGGIEIIHPLPSLNTTTGLNTLPPTLPHNEEYPTTNPTTRGIPYQPTTWEIPYY